MSARRLLQLLLAVQALAALGIGLAALQLFGASRWGALGAGLGSVLLVRLLINANNFRLSARYASPTPDDCRIGGGARLRMFLEEFYASMLQSSWTMPRARARIRIHPGAGIPVLLLHGYGCNSGYWSHLLPRLEAAGISHATLDLAPLTGDIDGYVAQVGEAVDALCVASGADRVVLVAHSMGGLVARAWMRACGTARVARVITLGTPHHGTCLAAFGIGRNAAQMRRTVADTGEPPECAWLRALAGAEDAAARALVTSIYSHHDNIVAPQSSSMLPGARNIAFGGVGHVALGRNRRVLDALMAELMAALNAGTGAASRARARRGGQAQ
ncbi:alpha/beta fold hydrolase [Massilia oculi]|uniref:Alpha/beta fold hydrolase n=1 Tax=Massilia hydrophila TaxID=3044279 RepID=A0ABS7YA47_9BURK|nr:alpha/beta fold hydrolase [Massilia oculi]MCA1856575.1 alpha/beta fold hydrolase [Massilia oculi]